MQQNYNKIMLEFNVWIEEGCIACERCVDTCPEVFEMQNDVAKVKDNINWSSHRIEIKEAAACCPVEVIHYEE
jgi:ferredoxin